MPNESPHEPCSTRKRRRIYVGFLDREAFLLAGKLARELQALNPWMSRRKACRMAIVEAARRLQPGALTVVEETP